MSAKEMFEELLDKGYCDCNEMNCIDNNSPRRILNIVKDLQNQLQQKENEIKRLNNIINELEKELDRGYRDLFEHELVTGRELITNIKNYLQELKENKK